MSCRDKLGNVCTYKVRLSLYFTVRPTISIEKQIENAQKVYGAHGIKIEIMKIYNLAIKVRYARLTRGYFDDIKTDCGSQNMSVQQKKLYNLTGSANMPTLVRCYFVNKITTSNRSSSAGKKIAGCGNYVPNRPAFLVAKAASNWTFAHELGHILLNHLPNNALHSDNIRNLMYRSTSSITIAVPELTTIQVRNFKSSRISVTC